MLPTLRLAENLTNKPEIFDSIGLGTYRLRLPFKGLDIALPRPLNLSLVKTISRPEMTDNNRVVVLLSGSGSTLQAILDQQPEYQYNVVGVISNRPDAYGLTRASAADIDTQSLNHTLFPDRPTFDQALIKKIDAYQPDLVVLAGYMRILSSPFVDHYQGKLINIHPSLLPKHKGLHTYKAALDAGDKEHGTSVHFVTEELDSGSVILQAALEITSEETVSSLEHRVKKMEQAIYPMAIDCITSGRITYTGNTVLLDKQALGPQGYRLTEDNLELL
jgi:phosphoribosylglycinamide formyltransferase-1